MTAIYNNKARARVSLATGEVSALGDCSIGQLGMICRFGEQKSGILGLVAVLAVESRKAE